MEKTLNLNEIQFYPDPEILINVFINLLFKRLNQEQPEVVSLKEDFKTQFQSIRSALESNSLSDIPCLRKKIVEMLNQLLRYACVDNPQSMYLHFIQELDRLINKLKENFKCKIDFADDNNFVDFPDFSTNSSFLFMEAKENMDINEQLIISKTQIKDIRNMIDANKKDMKLKQLNDFIKKDLFDKHSINISINSAMKIANDVESVIDLMNQAVQSS